MNQSILEKIDKPSDLKLIRHELLPRLVDEIRQQMIKTVSKTGGHLASSLGTVELIVAIHYVFNAPKDKIIFDVGHQAYAHKLITGRYKKFDSLRQYNGISGFPSRSESEYDCYGAGHSSTAISAGIGFAVARDLKRESHKVVVVIGDGSVTGGLTFEGLNNAGHLGTDILVILNDNQMFISYRIGAIASFLTKILTLGLIKKVEKKIENFLRRMHFTGLYLLRIAKRFKLLFFPGMLFEEMGFSYLGPINGHNLENLINILSKIKNMKGPVLLHVITKKGKGYEPAETNPIEFHGTPGFEIETGNRNVSSDRLTYTEVFSRTILELAHKDKKIVAVTAAMSQGTGLDEFSKQFPDRFFDVGIAEQHALVFSAGLAAEGFKPVCAIYSTFLQRGYDQIIHDIALQKLPVIIMVDRAGIVGPDGATHQGQFDISFLRIIPGLVIMSPKNGNELSDMFYSALSMKVPVVIRYPKAYTEHNGDFRVFNYIDTGKAEILKKGEDLYIAGIGDVVKECKKASEILMEKGINCGVINARFVKPLDRELFDMITRNVSNIVTVEENVITGGFGSAITEIYSSKARVLSIGLPDKFIEHGSRDELLKIYGLDADSIVEKIINWFDKIKVYDKFQKN